MEVGHPAQVRGDRILSPRLQTALRPSLGPGVLFPLRCKKRFLRQASLRERKTCPGASFLLFFLSFLDVSGRKALTSNKGPNHLCFANFSPRGARRTGLWPGPAVNPPQDRLLISCLKRCAGRLSCRLGGFGSRAPLGSGQLCLASPARVVCDGWLRQVSRRRVGAGARRQGVKVWENSNHQKSRRNSGKRREGGGCGRCFGTSFAPLRSRVCSRRSAFLSLFFSDSVRNLAKLKC